MRKVITTLALSCALVGGVLTTTASASSHQVGVTSSAGKTTHVGPDRHVGPARTVDQVTAARRQATAVAMPSVTAGEVKAATAALASCGCKNAPQVVYALHQLGVKSVSQSLLRKRLGKQVGDVTFVALAASLGTRVAKVRKRVPFPNYKARSAVTYRKTPYRVYEIFGVGLGPVYPHYTFKYGITRQLIPRERPERQLPTCTRYYGPSRLLNRRCVYRWIWIGIGWLQARAVEASYTLVYAITHQGHCPPGMPACI
jgi:hypothetical protein